MASLSQLAMPQKLEPRPLAQVQISAPSHLPMNQTALRNQYAKQIMDSAGSGNEHTIAYDDDGKVIADQTGQEHGVAFTPEQRKRLNGVRTIHNHHGDTAMSGADLASAQKYGWHGLSVVGDRYVYNVEPKDGGSFQPGDANTLYNGLLDQEMIKAHGKSDWPTITNAVMQQLADKMGWRYSREER